MADAKKEKYSVFTTGYIPEKAKTVESSGSRTAFLAVANDTADTMKSLGFTDKFATDLEANGFWRFVVTDITESFDEGMVLHNALSDTVSLFSTGALPIAITVNGFVLTVPGKDDRANFLKLYADRIRGAALDKARAILVFGYKDTVMRLFITQMGVTNAVGNDLYTNLMFTALASNYRCGTQNAAEVPTPQDNSATDAEEDLPYSVEISRD